MSPQTLVLRRQEITLLLNSRGGAALLGRDTDFELLFLDEENLSNLAKKAAQRGFCYLGLIAVTQDGEVGVQVEPGADAALVGRASAVFVMQVMARSQSDVQWLERLWALEDDRHDR